MTARLSRLFVPLAAAAALTTCGEPTSPIRPGVGTVQVLPRFDGFARLVPLVLDNVRVIVVRPPSTTLADVRRQFSVANNQLQLSVPVVLAAASEDLDVTLELYAGTVLLFRGTTTVRVAAGPASSPRSVPVTYQGPGAQVASLAVSPRDTTVTLGASVPFGATALDNQQVAVPQFYVSWSSGAGSIDAAGVLTAPTARDTFYVKATTPTGITDSTRVFVVAPPSVLLKVGGDNQSATVGARLVQLLAVQVNGSDGLPVPGVAVTFAAAIGGGSVDSATATTDAQGIARTGATLGTTPGAQTFTASAAGLAPVTFAMTASGIAPILVTLDGGFYHTCEIRGGTLLCWGGGGSGQLGDGTLSDRRVPVPVPGSFTSVTLGTGHSCALTPSGQAFCWGDNASGQLGDGTTTPRGSPTAVGGPQTFVQLVAGNDFTCGLTAGGQAFCWGSNTFGQLGSGPSLGRTLPTAVPGGPYAALAAGWSHACALSTAGAAFCWGLNNDGQLGTGNLTSTNLPTPLTGGQTFIALAAGTSSTCGIATGGAGFCWGLNFGAQLTSPQPVAGGFTYTAVAMGGNHVCGLTTGGWRCGGDNAFGQLGDGSAPTDQVTPVPPSGGFTFTALGAGANHTCGRTSTGTTRCWGDNIGGQLGDGSTSPASTPVLSVGPATSVAVSAGNNQTGSAGTALPVAPAVVVLDAAAQPVPGMEVTFAVTAGGGSLASPVVLTDNAGVATAGAWTLGATAGTNTLAATVGSGGVAGNPVSFTATGTIPSVVTWNGNVSNDWFTAANWTPAVVPGATTDVLIPTGPATMPVPTNTVTIRNLTLQAAGAISLAGSFTFTITGDLDNQGNFTVAGGTPTVALAGTARTARSTPLPMPVAVTGSYTLVGGMTVANTFSISGGTASLAIGGQLLSVSSLSVGSGGALVMTNPADNVVVSGNVTMAGGDHTGRLTAGVLQVQGNFLQSGSGSPLSFAASGTHTTQLNGFGSLTFQTPGAAASRFQNLLVLGNPVTLASRVVAGGAVTVQSGGLTLNGRTLEVLGSFTVAGAGSRLTMSNPLDSLLVGGDALFSGGNQLGFMSTGVLVVGGNLTQLATVSGDAFHPSGTHQTVLTGASPTLSFATPGDVPGTSHFQDVTWAGGGTLQLTSDAYAHGTLTTLSAGPSTIAGSDRQLHVTTLAATGPLSFSNTRLAVFAPTGGPLALHDLAFTGTNPAGVALTITHNGAGGPFSLPNLSFASVPTTGFYLQADDPDGATNGTLTLDLTTPTPTTPGGFVLAQGGAVVNWPSTSPTRTWAGTVSTNWSTAANWSPALVPTSSEDVTIPAGTPFSPTVTGSCDTRDLTLNPGATLAIGPGCSVSGDVVADGAITGAGILTMQAPGTVRGNLPAVTMSAAVTASGAVTTSGNLTINGTGTFTVTGQTVTVGNNLNTQGTGVLVMTNPADRVLVSGNANFGGGDETGLLSEGLLSIVGSLGQFGGSPAAFAASGNHVTELLSANSSLSIQVSGPGAGSSHLQNLVWAGGGTLTLFTGPYILGTTAVGAAGTIAGSGFAQTFHTGQLAASFPLTFFNAQLWLEPGSATPVGLSDLTFTVGSSITAMIIRHPGRSAGAPLTLDRVTFTNVPSFPAVYLDVDDTAPLDNNALVVNVTNASPASPSGLVNVANGATVNWPAAAPAKTWLGTTSDWHTTTNWSPAGVPTATDDVVIGGAPNQPVLSAPGVARDVTVQTGFLLNLNGFNLTVSGSVFAPIGTSFVGGGGTLVLTGIAKTLGGNLSSSMPVNVTGTYALSGRTTIGGLTMSGSGDLDINNQTLLVNGALNTTGSGTITMTNPLDSVLVTGAGIFGGGFEGNRLTQGYLKLGGSFNQTSGTTAGSFAASGAHTTELGAAAVRVVTFASPGFGTGTSQFNNLIISGATGGLTMNSSVAVLGTLVSTPPGATPTLTASPGRTLEVRGGTQVTGLIVDGPPVFLNLTTGGSVAWSGVTFQNMPSATVQFTLVHPGAATPIVLGNQVFTTVPTSGGLYLQAQDADGPTPDVLTVALSNPTPGTDGGFSQALGGAVIQWPQATPAKIWTGAVDRDWNNGANWNGGGPGITGDAVIPAGTPNSPQLTTNRQIGTLQVQVGASLDLNGKVLTVNNTVDVPGTVTSSVAGGFLATSFGPIRGNFANHSLELGLGGAAASLNGTVALSGTGAVFISGDVTIGAQSLLAAQAVVKTFNGVGRLIMSSAFGNVLADSMDFSGGDETGLLTAGLIQTRSLAQGVGGSAHPASFFGSGSHRVFLGGTTPSQVSFANPATSRFQDLEVTGVAGLLTLNTNVTVAGQLQESAVGTNGPTLTGAGVTLTAGGASVTVGTAGLTALTFDGVPLVLSGGAITAFSDITFTNQSPVGTALTVNNVGQGTPFPFVNLTFTTTLTAGGFHLVANDLDGPAIPLVIDMIGASPATGAGVSQATNGAVINWPPSAGTFTWTGSVSPDWSDPGNWDLAQVPGTFDNVILASTTLQPVLSTDVGINDLTIQAGASLDLGTHVLAVGGTADLAGPINGAGGSGVTLVGTGTLARGTINTTVVVGGSYILNGGLSVLGDLAISGSLGIETFTLNLVGNLSTIGSGVLDMTTIGGQVNVTGDAIFAGGSTVGRLTAGTLRVTGNFSQFSVTSATSYAPSGSHTTELPANGLVTVSLTSLGTGASGSHFMNLDVSGSTGAITLGSNLLVDNTLLSSGPGPVLQGNGNSLTARAVAVTGLTVDNAPIIIDDQGSAAAAVFDNVTFQNFPQTGVTQLRLLLAGSSLAVRSLTFNNTTFSHLSTVGGGALYVDGVVSNGAAFWALTLQGSSEGIGVGGNGPSFTSTGSGATVNWP